MSDERRQRALVALNGVGVDTEASQDERIIKTTCPFDDDCIDESIRIDLQSLNFACEDCHEEGHVDQLISAKKRQSNNPASLEAIDAEFTEVTQASRAVVLPEPKVHTLTAQQAYTPPPPPPPPPPKRTMDRATTTLLALVFLIAGLGAAGRSGFANFTAFSSSVAHPLQSKIWGWTGVIASVISFGGFTFFYWHTANRRFKEGVRALPFAPAGAITSIIGTQLYIANNNAAASSAATQATSNRAVLESQLTDWRAQLEGTPDNTRPAEELQSELPLIERAKRSHQTT